MVTRGSRINKAYLAVMLVVASAAAPAGARPSSDPEANADEIDHSAGAPAAEVPAWISLRAALDDDFRPTLEDLPQLIVTIADLRHEVLLGFDDDGGFIFYAEGEHNRVDIQRRQLAQLRGGTLLHNHPRGTSPSDTDYAALCSLGVSASIVAARVRGKVVQARIALEGAGAHAVRRRCITRSYSTLVRPTWTRVALDREPTWVQVDLSAPNSRRSQTRAATQSRSMVATETSSTDATSATVKPPK